MMDGRVQKTRQHKVFANQRDLTKMPEQCLAQAARQSLHCQQKTRFPLRQ